MAAEVELLLNSISFILPLLSRARTTLLLGTLRKSQNRKSTKIRFTDRDRLATWLLPPLPDILKYLLENSASKTQRVTQVGRSV